MLFTSRHAATGVLPEGEERRAAATTGPSVVFHTSATQAAFRDLQARQILSQANARALNIITIAGVAHTVPYSVQIVADESVRAAVDTVLQGCFQMVDTILNDYNPNSEVSRLNRAEVNTRVELSPHLHSVLYNAKEISRATGDCFDIAVAPLHDYLVAFVRNSGGKMPSSPEELAELKRLAAFSQFDAAWKLDGKGGIVRKHPEARLMLGAISKGYTVDIIVDALKAAGFENCLVEWGGDIKAAGKNHRGELWKVGVAEPPSVDDVNTKLITADAPQPLSANEGVTTPSLQLLASAPKYLCVLELDDAAVCTSGDYQNFAMPGHPWTHTVDTTHLTLLTARTNEVAQCSIVSSSCMVADALATAALCKGEISRIRGMADRFRYVKDRVTDFVAFVRADGRTARMHELCSETADMRAERISHSLPARVIVVGGGLAGVAAAIEAANCGANVILLEKTKALGGNSAKATSGINGWGTRPQAMKGVLDDGKYFERDTYLSGLGGRCDPGLVSTLSIKSSEAIAWLMKTTGLSLTTLFQLGGHSRPRTHRVPDSTDGKPVAVGYTIMSTLANVITKQYERRITVIPNAAVQELLYADDWHCGDTVNRRVTGVRYRNAVTEETMSLTADAVILATGGFSCDVTSPNSLVKEFAPHLLGTATTNGPFATGDGVKMARAIGATLVDMDKIQLHPTGFVDPKNPANNTKFLGPEALRGSGGILLNSKGERFVNELDLRSVVSAAIQKQGTVYPESNGCQVAYCVLNQAAIQLFGKAQLGFYKDKAGLFKDAATVADLAAIIGCPAEAVQQTLAKYEQACKAGRCAATGKTVFPSVIGAEGPFVVAVITPVLHYTMGGVSISPSTEVQVEVENAVTPLERKKPILGLFAAGEVSAGVHGGNRLGGNSLLECVVFGRIAGDRAATILQTQDSALSEHEWRPVVVREVSEGITEFGQGSRIIRFNLPGSTQRSGMKLGQFVSISGDWDGVELQGFYSPISLPEERGSIALLCRTDKGSLKEWISALQPGVSVHMKACGGLGIDCCPKNHCLMLNGRRITRLGMVAGGTGIAPMLQILRVALRDSSLPQLEVARLMYAAETEAELTYRDVLRAFEKKSQGKFACSFCVNSPPPGWVDDVGFIDKDVLRSRMIAPAAPCPLEENGNLILICGPPVMQRAVRGILLSMGHPPETVRTVDDQHMMGP